MEHGPVRESYENVGDRDGNNPKHPQLKRWPKRSGLASLVTPLRFPHWGVGPARAGARAMGYRNGTQKRKGTSTLRPSRMDLQFVFVMADVHLISFHTRPLWCAC